MLPFCSKNSRPTVMPWSCETKIPGFPRLHNFNARVPEHGGLGMRLFYIIYPMPELQWLSWYQYQHSSGGEYCWNFSPSGSPPHITPTTEMWKYLKTQYRKKSKGNLLHVHIRGKISYKLSVECIVGWTRHKMLPFYSQSSGPISIMSYSREKIRFVRKRQVNRNEQTHIYLCIHEQSMNHNSLKIGLDVM